MTLKSPRTYPKAITAAVATAASVLGGGMADGNLTGAEAIIAVGAGLVAGAAVYQVPYRV